MKDDHYYDQLKNHTLEQVQDGVVKAYYLRLSGKSRTRMMSTLILFTPEGIALMGDLTPERSGSISMLGYGVDWFAGELSRDYLASKFLEQKWSEEQARIDLAQIAAQMHAREVIGGHGDVLKRTIYPDPEDHRLANKITALLKDGFDGGAEWLYHELEDIGYDVSDGIPGRGYLEHEIGWLSAIQRRFSELYHARVLEPAGASS